MCEVVDVAGMVRSSKFSESDVSTSTVAVPVELLGSTGSISSGGTASSGEASGSDGSSSSSSSCASSSSGTRMVGVPGSAHAVGTRLPGVPIRKKMLRKSRGRSCVMMLVERIPPRRTNRERSLSARLA